MHVSVCMQVSVCMHVYVCMYVFVWYVCVLFFKHACISA
jgi:hypothetical protein